MRSEARAAPGAVHAALADLRAHDLSCAPHVVARLLVALDEDPVTIREVVARLDPAERSGLRPLPTPLPCTPAVAAAFAAIRLSERDRDALLAAALLLEPELDPLLAFDGRGAAELASGELGRHLVIRAGRVRFADPRLAIWVRHICPPAVEARTHARLGEILHRLGDDVGACWHRARASLEAADGAASGLVSAARSLSEAGRSDRALQLAAEAAAHAHGALLDEARLVAGAAATGGGYATEALHWLGLLFPDGVERFRMQGLAGLIVSHAHLNGAVPDVDPRALRPRTDDREDWHSWSRAAAFAAVLCAERGDRAGMRTWLEALREGCAKTGAERQLRDPVVALTWLIAGERDADSAGSGSGPVSGGMLRALRAAVSGSVDEGLRLLAAGDVALDVDVDQFVAGFELSPVVLAYRAVTETLLLTWSGDIAAARSRITLAALDLPVAVPFAGLGVALARRLDLAVAGELTPFTLALTDALPPGLRVDRLVDRAIHAYLRGSFDEAAATMRVWLDRGAPQPVFAIPALEEVAAEPDLDHGPTVASPGIALARRLRVRIATAPDARWRVEREEIRREARTLGSPFARARVEAMLGVRSLISGDVSSGRGHLMSARSLFDEAGASAWARAVDARLQGVDAAEGTDVAIDPLAACRHAWEGVLRPRELEVAMLAAGGASNREIADRLSVSVRTVEVHLGRVFTKLGVRSRVELTVLAHRTGQFL